MIEKRKHGKLMPNLYLFGKFTLPILFYFILLCCKGVGTQTHQSIEKKDIEIFGIYPKIFPCVGRAERLCVYYTGENGYVWFFPIENFDNPIPTIGYNAKNGFATPVLFSHNLTAVVEIRLDNPKYFLMVNGVTNLYTNVSFASANTRVILFGDEVRREFLLLTNQGFLNVIIPNDKNILFELGGEGDVLTREIEITGVWGKCSSVVSAYEDVVEGIVFSEEFSALNYFFFSKDRTISEFVGWDRVEEYSSPPEPMGILSLYSIKIKGNAYPSVNSTKISPPYSFGFLDLNTIVLVSPSSPPPDKVKVEYMDISKKYQGNSCSISSVGNIPYIFVSDGKELVSFQKRLGWNRERIADFSVGEILSFVYRDYPCVVFTNLRDMILKISCRLNDGWKFKDIDSGFIYGLNIYNDGSHILRIIYNVLEKKVLKIRLSEVNLEIW